MTDFGAQARVASPLFISTIDLNSPLSTMSKHTTNLNAAANLTWVANHAVFVPMVVPVLYPVRRVFWGNGSTLTTSNADFGIYNGDGTLLYSTGSTALSGATAPQFVDATDFWLPPGSYYFAYVCDNTTSRSTGYAATAIMQRLGGVLQQASALPLPATMASAVAATQAIYPLCGITRTPSGF